ncbi:hypothetical protein [Streptomyces altiplanensis]
MPNRSPFSGTPATPAPHHAGVGGIAQGLTGKAHGEVGAAVQVVVEDGQSVPEAVVGLGAAGQVGGVLMDLRSSLAGSVDDPDQSGLGVGADGGLGVGNGDVPLAVTVEVGGPGRHGCGGDPTAQAVGPGTDRAGVEVNAEGRLTAFGHTEDNNISWIGLDSFSAAWH